MIEEAIKDLEIPSKVYYVFRDLHVEVCTVVEKDEQFCHIKLTRNDDDTPFYGDIFCAYHSITHAQEHVCKELKREIEELQSRLHTLTKKRTSIIMDLTNRRMGW